MELVFTAVSMSIQDIYAHYLLPDESGKIKSLSNIFLKNTMTRYKKQHVCMMTKIYDYIKLMIKNRDDIV